MLSNDQDLTGLPILASTETNLDPKYRILLPKDVRERLGRGFAMWLGDFGCIYACTTARWASLMAEIQGIPSNNEGRRSYHALTYRYASDNLFWDEQGRVTIPDQLRGPAKIVRDVYLGGQIDHLEIWSLEEWKSYDKDPGGYNLRRMNDLTRARALMDAAPRQTHSVEEALRRNS